jgi:hypothetical protein
MTLRRTYTRTCPHCGATFETRTANAIVCGKAACLEKQHGTKPTHWHYDKETVNARILRIARAGGSKMTDEQIIERCREIDAEPWRWTA